MRKHIVGLIMLLVAASAPMSAANKSAELPDPYEGYDEAVFMDMNLEQNLSTPELRPEEQEPVRRQMRKLAAELAGKKFMVELDRDDEVVVVTIPAEQLFLPNDTLLRHRAADERLRPLLHYLKPPGLMKLVYAVHSDNTGSESYNYELSQQRVNTLYDWLLEHASDDLVIIPYAMGDSEPRSPNTSRAGRRDNRRVEFFLVPGPEMILRARQSHKK